MRILYTICAALLATVVGLVGPAVAEKVCKDYVTATGSAAVLNSGAPKKARAAWSRAVTARYGEFWNDWSKAAGANDQSNCGRAYKYLHRCEARARLKTPAPPREDILARQSGAGVDAKM